MGGGSIMSNIDFLLQQDRIVNYIKENYKNYMEEGLPAPNDYVNDFLDFDKYKNNTTMFFDFPTYLFERNTNESELQELNMTVFIVVRNDTPEVLRKNILRYTTAFYKFFDETGLNGLVDYGVINELSFYFYVEGQKNLKIAEINMVLNLEV
jgi:hypothetical protein